MDDDTFGLATILSEDELIALAENFGGTRLYIPNTVKPQHRIALAIGVDGLQRLRDQLGSGTINVPVFRSLRVYRLRSEGLSNPAIARRLVMSEKAVQKALARSNRNFPPRSKVTRPQTHVQGDSGYGPAV